MFRWTDSQSVYLVHHFRSPVKHNRSRKQMNEFLNFFPMTIGIGQHIVANRNPRMTASTAVGDIYRVRFKYDRVCKTKRLCRMGIIDRFESCTTVMTVFFKKLLLQTRSFPTLAINSNIVYVSGNVQNSLRKFPLDKRAKPLFETRKKYLRYLFELLFLLNGKPNRFTRVKKINPKIQSLSKCSSVLEFHGMYASIFAPDVVLMIFR